LSAPAAGTLRAFIALELPPATKARLASAARDLVAHCPGLRLVAEDTLHLTLRFLGRTAPDAAARIAAALAVEGARCEGTVAPFSGLGCFPERGRVRVLWARLDLPPRFAALQAACEAIARGEGFEPEDQRFSPHVTLGRWREPAARPTLPELDLGKAAVTELVLFKSDLTPRGPRYTALSRVALPGAAA
jgi:2'-5' RNA ligase